MENFGSLEPDPNAAAPVAASRPWVAPAILVAFPLPVIVVDVEAHIRGIGVLFLLFAGGSTIFTLSHRDARGYSITGDGPNLRLSAAEASHFFAGGQ